MNEIMDTQYAPTADLPFATMPLVYLLPRSNLRLNFAAPKSLRRANIQRRQDACEQNSARAPIQKTLQSSEAKGLRNQCANQANSSIQ
jgi:hypothetical protein